MEQTLKDIVGDKILMLNPDNKDDHLIDHRQYFHGNALAI